MKTIDSKDVEVRVARSGSGFCAWIEAWPEVGCYEAATEQEALGRAVNRVQRQGFLPVIVREKVDVA